MSHSCWSGERGVTRSGMSDKRVEFKMVKTVARAVACEVYATSQSHTHEVSDEGRSPLPD